MSESRPPLFFNFNGGLLSSIFSKNHSKCLKLQFSLKKPFYAYQITALKWIRTKSTFNQRQSKLSILWIGWLLDELYDEL